MTGLEKIIDQIQQEAQATSAEILANADAKCNSILESAQAECDQIRTAGEQDAKGLRADLLARGESGAQLQRKNRILAAKQEMIQDVIQKAQKKLLNMQSVDYFVMLGKMAKKYAQQGDGRMYLSSTDLSRVPVYFPKKLSEIAAEKGGTLVLADEPREISGGFVLAYGGIEENCSFEALFEAKKEQLQDIVRAKLFS